MTNIRAIKARWRDASLTLRNFSQSNKNDKNIKNYFVAYLSTRYHLFCDVAHKYKHFLILDFLSGFCLLRDICQVFEPSTFSRVGIISFRVSSLKMPTPTWCLAPHSGNAQFASGIMNNTILLDMVLKKTGFEYK